MHMTTTAAAARYSVFMFISLIALCCGHCTLKLTHTSTHTYAYKQTNKVIYSDTNQSTNNLKTIHTRTSNPYDGITQSL